MFNETNRHYSLRKLSVGLASVLIGISFASSMNSNSVKADTVNGDSNSAQTVKVNDTAIKGSDAVVKTDAESAPEGQNQTPEAVKKDSGVITQDIEQKAEQSNNSSVVQEDSSAKGDSLADKNKALKAKVEATKKAFAIVLRADSSETALNLKGTNAIDPETLKEDKTETIVKADPAKSKLKMATLLTITGKKFNAQMLSASKVISPTNDTNGGFDSSWGTLNVNNWQGSVQGDYYQLTNYTGDANHVIVPNEADFAKAGISTSGKHVGVTSDLMHTIFRDKTTAQDATVAFSKTDNKQVKAINADWSDTWNSQYTDRGAKLSRFDGTNLDVSNVTNMSQMFNYNNISNISSLAHWDTSNVTDMSYMFSDCKSLRDISPLANWDTSKVTDMRDMFINCNNLSNISSLSNWDVSSVTDMRSMFDSCANLSDISPLANWDTSNATSMASMFSGCSNLSDISSLANWDTSKVTDMANMFSYCKNLSDISLLTHWDTSKVTDMRYMFDSCANLSDISPLANWDTSEVIQMSAMFEGCSNLSDISSLANWDTSKVTNMASMFAGTPLKKVTLTNWDFSNADPSSLTLFPDTNFEATLSDKTSKSLLGIASEKLDQPKEILKVVDSAPIVDGVPDVEGRIQDYLNSIKQKKEGYQQQLAKYKQQIDYYKKELADPNADDATKANNQHELKQAEQEYQSYLTGDGKKSFDEDINDLQGELEQYKQMLQQEINLAKLQAEYPLDSVFGNHSKITTPNRDLLVYLVGKLPVKSDAATRTIEITFPDGTKKTINQSVGYGKHAISGTADMATHKLDMAMPYELSKWELIKKEDGSYDLIKAHVDKNGVASFDDIQLPQIPGYKAVVKTVASVASPVNPASALFAVSFMALPKPATSVPNDTKPAETVSPATPVAIEVAKPIKTEPKVTISATPKAIDLSNDAVTTTPKETIWQVADEPDQDTYQVSNGKYAVELPHISNAQLHVIANDSTKDSILFTYKGQKAQYVFKIKFVNGHYLLTTYKIKSGKLVKLIDYNFASSAKIISVILSWFQLK